MTLLNELGLPEVEPCYVPCMCCDWLILEKELHSCDCGRVHTPEWSWPEGGIPESEIT